MRRVQRCSDVDIEPGCGCEKPSSLRGECSSTCKVDRDDLTIAMTPKNLFVSDCMPYDEPKLRCLSPWNCLTLNSDCGKRSDVQLL